MKSIKYFFICVMLLLTLSSTAFRTPGGTKVAILQATGKSDATTLKQSAGIISDRLKLFGLNSFEVTVSAESGQIKINMPDNTELSEIEGLLTSRGEISFYESYDHAEVSEMFKKDNQLFMVISNDQEQASSSPVIGCVKENPEKAEAYLKSLPPVRNCRLLWGSEKEKSGYCLFALKTGEDGKALLVRSDIESVKFITSGTDNMIHIRLKPGASEIFSRATAGNIGKSIVIVIDDKVYSWPVVRDVIKGGEIEVSGSFRASEVRFFPDIFNTDPLPLSFKLIK
jgi:preprotein translocase subunit SecD